MATKKQEKERKVDEALEATFPASDPPANGKDVGPDKLANFDSVVVQKPEKPKR